MKCSQCSDYKTTVGEVRDCPRCRQSNDGTAALIPAKFYDGDKLELAVAEVAGLGNRFVQGDPGGTDTAGNSEAGAAAAAVANKAEVAQKGEKAKPEAERDPVRKAPAKPRTRTSPTRPKAKKSAPASRKSSKKK
jgi:hypothetical protein